MTRFTLTLAMAAWFTTTLYVNPASTPTNKFIVIQDNAGGAVDTFKNAKNDLVRIKYAVHFKGYCASACTILLNVPGSCVYPGTKLLYHSMYMFVNKNGKRVKEVLPFDDQVELLTELPSRLRTYLITNHTDVAVGLEDKDIILDATRFVKTCENVK